MRSAESQAPDLEEVILLAKLVGAEGTGQPLLGKVAIAFVPLNRQRFRGGTLQGIIVESGEFRSFVIAKRDSTSFAHEAINHPLDALGVVGWHENRLIAYMALAGYLKNPFPNATHFDFEAPYWARPEWLLGCIQKHCFYAVWPEAQEEEGWVVEYDK